MTILKIQSDETLKVGMYSIQTLTVDGRAWQLDKRFVKDDPKLVRTIRAIEAKGEIDTARWTEMHSLGSSTKAADRSDLQWKGVFAKQEQAREQAAFRADMDRQS